MPSYGSSSHRGGMNLYGSCRITRWAQLRSPVRVNELDHNSRGKRCQVLVGAVWRTNAVAGLCLVVGRSAHVDGVSRSASVTGSSASTVAPTASATALVAPA